ncbi:MAG: hypothetical protein JWQ73_4113 [Variovorax sp.]|nr:hypothetical protein [Variovorax sp.]
MSALQLLDSLLNFVAPAFFIAVVLALAARFLMRKKAGTAGFWTQAGINFLAGVAVLAAGLAVYGRDGMMWTYVALVAVCGTGQWLLAGGARR